MPDNRPWICVVCLREFITSGALDRHIAAEHDNENDE